MKQIFLLLQICMAFQLAAQADLEHSMCCDQDFIAPRMLERTSAPNLAAFQILDSIASPMGFLVHDTIHHSFYFATQYGAGFELIEFARSQGPHYSIDTVYQFPFDSTGSEEIIIEYQDHFKWNHANLGGEGQERHLLILDIDKAALLFDEIIAYHSNYWGPDPAMEEESYDTTIYARMDYRLSPYKLTLQANTAASNVPFEDQATILYLNLPTGLKKMNTDDSMGE